MYTKNPPLVFAGRIVGACMLTLFLPFLSSAQKASSGSASSPGKWQHDATVNGVMFYHYIESCNGKNVVFLKMKNTNSYKVEISWKEVFTTQYEKEAEGIKGQKKLVIPAGELSETDCKQPGQKNLVVLPDQVNPAYPAEVSSFRFKAITVSRVN